MFKKKFKVKEVKDSYTYWMFYIKDHIFQKWRIHYIASDEVDRDIQKNKLGII